MPFDPGVAGVKQRKDTLGELRPCKTCTKPVLRSHHEQFGLNVDLDPEPRPIDPSWSPEWAPLTWRWHPRVGFCSVSFRTTTSLVYVAHPCGVRRST